MDCSNDSFWKFDKLDLAFVVIILAVSMFFNVTCFAAEIEEVTTSIIYNINIYYNHNYFYDSSGNSIRYFPIEKGYIYHISNPDAVSIRIAVSSELPALNVPYDFLGTTTEDYDYMATSNSYLYFSFAPGQRLTVTREKLSSMTGAVDSLSAEVGVSQIWGIFNFAIPYVLVVVVAVFGFFIVRRIIKGSDKGRIKF